MQITTKNSFLGFILAISTLGTASAQAKVDSIPHPPLTLDIEQRLARLTTFIQQQESQEVVNNNLPDKAIAGWGNIRGGGGFVNNRGGGGFVNNRGGGGFINNRWGDGGRFYNRY